MSVPCGARDLEPALLAQTVDASGALHPRHPPTSNTSRERGSLRGRSSSGATALCPGLSPQKIDVEAAPYEGAAATPNGSMAFRKESGADPAAGMTAPSSPRKEIAVTSSAAPGHATAPQMRKGTHEAQGARQMSRRRQRWFVEKSSGVSAPYPAAKTHGINASLETSSCHTRDSILVSLSERVSVDAKTRWCVQAHLCASFRSSRVAVQCSGTRVNGLPTHRTARDGVFKCATPGWRRTCSLRKHWNPGPTAYKKDRIQERYARRTRTIEANDTVPGRQDSTSRIGDLHLANALQMHSLHLLCTPRRQFPTPAELSGSGPDIRECTCGAFSAVETRTYTSDMQTALSWCIRVESTEAKQSHQKTRTPPHSLPSGTQQLEIFSKIAGNHAIVRPLRVSSPHTPTSIWAAANTAKRALGC